jgi:hypothetical protein
MSKLRAVLVGLVAGLSAWTLAPAVSAQSSPYPTGTTGYDVSYPQCGAATANGSFGIVGVNHGRPFTVNSCVGAEYSAAAARSLTPSLYINTGYSGAYRKNVTSACGAASRSISGSSAQQQAWAIGCSEAETSLTYAKSASKVLVWWLDVETANSWSSSDLSLNRYAISGAASRLEQTSLPVGVYSSSSMWATITGGNFTPVGIVADWETPGGVCASTGFTNSPVWLLQSTGGGFDSDLAC